MDTYTKEELTEAHRAIQSLLSKCERALEKFLQGTSQYILLKNRINGLSISLTLIRETLETQEKE